MKEVNFEEISGTSADSSIIIAAAGKGTRLNSNVPKILYPIAGKAILEWIYEYCSDLCGEIIIVLSPQGKKDVEPFINKKGFKNVKVAVQNTPIGMADAIKIGFKECSNNKIFVVWGDQPCFTKKTLEFMNIRLTSIKDCQMIFPALKNHNPYVHYETNDKGLLIKVLEKRENDNMPRIGLSDSGLFLLKRDALENILCRIEYASLGNITNEKSFIRLLPILENDIETIVYFFTCNKSECLSINTQEEAEVVEKHLLSIN